MYSHDDGNIYSLASDGTNSLVHTPDVANEREEVSIGLKLNMRTGLYAQQRRRHFVTGMHSGLDCMTVHGRWKQHAAHRRASASAVRWASSRSADSAASHACRDSRCSESSFARLVASCGAGARSQTDM